MFEPFRAIQQQLTEGKRFKPLSPHRHSQRALKSPHTKPKSVNADPFKQGRINGREAAEMPPVLLCVGVEPYAEGSGLLVLGGTRIYVSIMGLAELKPDKLDKYSERTSKSFAFLRKRRPDDMVIDVLVQQLAGEEFAQSFEGFVDSRLGAHIDHKRARQAKVQNAAEVLMEVLMSSLESLPDRPLTGGSEQPVAHSGTLGVTVSAIVVHLEAQSHLIPGLINATTLALMHGKFALKDSFLAATAHFVRIPAEPADDSIEEPKNAGRKSSSVAKSKWAFEDVILMMDDDEIQQVRDVKGSEITTLNACFSLETGKIAYFHQIGPAPPPPFDAKIVALTESASTSLAREINGLFSKSMEKTETPRGSVEDDDVGDEWKAEGW